MSSLHHLIYIIIITSSDDVIDNHTPRIRIFATALFSALSFILVGLSLSVALVIVGVVCASIGSGLGEITFLSFTARYHKSTVSGWGSGTGESHSHTTISHFHSVLEVWEWGNRNETESLPTGAAGIGGALVYAGLRTFLSAKVTILLQLVVPVMLVVAYLFLLTKPAKTLSQTPQSHPTSPTEQQPEQDKGRRRVKLKFINREEARYFISHVKYVPHLVQYMVPLYLVYISEYMINQGLFELLYYPNTRLGSICLDQRDQYRWLATPHDVIVIYRNLIGGSCCRYQVVYQLGVFISRSSLFLVHIKWFWILAILQVNLT